MSHVRLSDWFNIFVCFPRCRGEIGERFQTEDRAVAHAHGTSELWSAHSSYALSELFMARFDSITDGQAYRQYLGKQTDDQAAKLPTQCLGEAVRVFYI